MVTFTLSQSVWESTESRALRTMRASVVYVSRCQLFIFMCQRDNERANVPKVCQLFNLAFQRAKSVLMFQLGMPTCQTALQFFILACQPAKRRAKFLNNLFTKCLGEFLYFIITWKILHYTWYHSYTHDIYICIVHKNCLRVLYFLHYSSLVNNLHDVCFSNKNAFWRVHAFLNRSVYTRLKWKIIFSSILH